MDAVTYAQMGEHAASALCHADGLSGTDMESLFHGCGRDQPGCEYRTLAPDAAHHDIDVTLFIHK
jgi:hypothetical protein